MRHVRIVGVCLIAAFAMSAAVAASALAMSPEWGGCEATSGGKYADSACTVKAHPRTSGKYEWYTGERFGTVYNHGRGKEVPFGLKEYNLDPVFGATTFETTSGKKMECEEGNGFMQLEGPKTAKGILLHFTGCQSEGQPCNSQFFESGEVNNELNWENEEGLKGKLGFVSGKGTESPVVGLDLTQGTVNKDEAFVLAICEGPIGSILIGGNKKGGNSVISLITPVDAMVGKGEVTPEFTQTFSGESGVQSPTRFEHGHVDTLQMFLGNEARWEQSAWTAAVAVPPESGEPPIEIRAMQ